ncbi:hypothetical protein ACGK9U_15055 [Mariniflexile sp. HNIBRBA6329]|uniref:hypothetical protein n=1 Tax=Mariniflexile sp. HNIBRBA6329 TaxID=3373088 RepID=UPI003745C5A9
MKLDEKQSNYYKKWESIRNNKLKYLFKKAMLDYALPFSIFMTIFELIDSRFIFSYKILTDFLILFLIGSVLGTIVALISFRISEKKHIKFKGNLHNE